MKKMGSSMLEIFRIIKRMAMENLFKMRPLFIVDIGKMTNIQAKELFIAKIIFMMESFLKVNFMERDIFRKKNRIMKR